MMLLLAIGLACMFAAGFVSGVVFMKSIKE